MYTYIFTGKLEPENLIKSFNLTSAIDLEQPNFGIKGALVISIKNNHLEIVYTSQEDHSDKTSSNLETLKNYIQETVELLINLYGYVHSLALDVYILNVKCDKLGIDFEFGIKGEYNINKTEQEGSDEFKKLFSIFEPITNSPVKDVFSDFHKAIKHPSMTGQFCFRAIETIRMHYFDDSTNINIDQRRENGWDTLRSELSYQRADFDQVMQYGIPNRHGKYPAITYPVREQILNFTRQLIDKFIDVKLGVK